MSDIRRYIKLGPLGQAFAAMERHVLLIDEVDKADLEFPNDLLRELDEMRFTVVETSEEVHAQHRPVLLITSNNEKELPDAFLRRCIFHYIEISPPWALRAPMGSAPAAKPSVPLRKEQDVDALTKYDEKGGRYPTKWSELGPRYNE